MAIESSLSSRYKIAYELARVFGPEVERLQINRFHSGDTERHHQFMACCNRIFRAFGTLSTYLAEPVRAESTKYCDQILNELRLGFDFLSVHWWDPLTSTRSGILTFFSESSPFLKRWAPKRLAIDYYRRIERIYLKLTDLKRPSLTFVQGVAESVRKAPRPIAVTLWPDDSPPLNDPHLLENDGVSLISFPATTLHRLFDDTELRAQIDHALDPTSDDEATERILHLLQEPPGGFIGDERVEAFRQAITQSQLIDSLTDERLWSMASGLFLWQYGLGLLPYTLVLLPIPAAPAQLAAGDALYFALSGSCPSTKHENSGATLASLNHQVTLLADAFTLALCAMAPTLRELWEYECRTGRFYKHEVHSRLRDYEDWLGFAMDAVRPEMVATLPVNLTHYLVATIELLEDAATAGAAWGPDLKGLEDKISESSCSWALLFTDLVYEFLSPSELDEHNGHFFFLIPTGSDNVRVSFAEFLKRKDLLALVSTWPAIALKSSFVRTMIVNLLRNTKDFDDAVELRPRLNECPGYADVAVFDRGPEFEYRSRENGTGLPYINAVVNLARKLDGRQYTELFYPPVKARPKEFVLRLPLEAKRRKP